MCRIRNVKKEGLQTTRPKQERKERQKMLSLSFCLGVFVLCSSCLSLSLRLSLCPHRLLFRSCLSICLALFVFRLLIECCRCLCRVVSCRLLNFYFSSLCLCLCLCCFFPLNSICIPCVFALVGSSLIFAFETIEKGQRARFFVSFTCLGLVFCLYLVPSLLSCLCLAFRHIFAFCLCLAALSVLDGVLE
jgi:hypothetical protein